jgi:hypothetical protein
MTVMKRLDELEYMVKGLDRRLVAVEDKVRNVSGRPVITALLGARLELNGNMDVLAINRRIDKLEGQIKGGA